MPRGMGYKIVSGTSEMDVAWWTERPWFQVGGNKFYVAEMGMSVRPFPSAGNYSWGGNGRIWSTFSRVRAMKAASCRGSVIYPMVWCGTRLSLPYK